MFSEIVQCIFGTMGAIFEAIFSLLPIYNQLSDLRNQIFACVLGVPVIVISLIFVGIKAIRFFLKH